MGYLIPVREEGGGWEICVSSDAEETWISHPPPSPRAGTKYPVQANPSLRLKAAEAACRSAAALLEVQKISENVRKQSVKMLVLDELVSHTEPAPQFAFLFPN